MTGTGPGLDSFHDACQELDLRAPLQALLGEFQQGRIADQDRTLEDSAIRSHLGELSTAWDQVLPQFPHCPGKRRSITWEYFRGRRDAYLISLIAAYVSEHQPASSLIVNPAAVFGRHARSLARQLPGHRVVATDIDPNWNRLYRLVSFWKYPALTNCTFQKENVFAPDLQRNPSAVVFFGACGAVTDGCMDYAIAVEAPFLIFRSCCHDNIGGNTEIVRRSGFMNWFFAFKNRQYEKMKTRTRWQGFYFSDRYRPEAYPRSRAARQIMDSDTILAVARHSPDSDVCRSLIDLDRCLYLQENGYDVMYREELFFAHRRPEVLAPRSSGAPLRRESEHPDTPERGAER